MDITKFTDYPIIQQTVTDINGYYKTLYRQIIQQIAANFNGHNKTTDKLYLWINYPTNCS
jgi:hypothetical protein